MILGIMARSVTGRAVEPSGEYRAAVQGVAPEEAERFCWACGQKGVKVFPPTLRNHTDARYWSILDQGFRFSANPNCPVIYFNNAAGVYFFKDETKTRFGPKEKEPVRPICYCIGVTEEMIEDEVLRKGCCDSLEDIESYTKAGTGKWCFVTNPSGKCCRDYLPEVVNRYLAAVKEPHVQRLLGRVSAELQGTGEEYRDVALKISGMTCESCTIAVTNAMESVGAKNVKVSLSTGSATAQLPKTVLATELAKVVGDVGYESTATDAPS